MSFALQVILMALALSAVLGWLTHSRRVALGVLAFFGLAAWLETVEPAVDWMRGFQEGGWFSFAKGAIIVGGVIALDGWAERRKKRISDASAGRNE